jgi:hypothetical protein
LKWHRAGTAGLRWVELSHSGWRCERPLIPVMWKYG